MPQILMRSRSTSRFPKLSGKARTTITPEFKASYSGWRPTMPPKPTQRSGLRKLLSLPISRPKPRTRRSYSTYTAHSPSSSPERSQKRRMMKRGRNFLNLSSNHTTPDCLATPKRTLTAIPRIALALPGYKTSWPATGATPTSKQDWKMVTGTS